MFSGFELYPRWVPLTNHALLLCNLVTKAIFKWKVTCETWDNYAKRYWKIA